MFCFTAAITSYAAGYRWQLGRIDKRLPAPHGAVARTQVSLSSNPPSQVSARMLTSCILQSEQNRKRFKTGATWLVVADA